MSDSANSQPATSADSPGSPLDELIAAHISGDLNDEQRQKLNLALRADGAAREQFLAALRQEILLGEVLREQIERQELRATPAAGAALPAAAKTNAAALGDRPAEKPARSWRPWRNWRAAATFAALLALATTLFVTHRPNEPLPAVALVVSAGAGASIQHEGKTTPVVAGSGLFARDRMETTAAGTVSLRYADGTAMTLKENSAAVFDYPKHGGKMIALERGALTADVVKQPTNQPMTLSTSDATATVLGTRFTLAAELGQSTLAVDEGHVRLLRKADQKTVEVSTGNIAVVSANVSEIEVRSLAPTTPPVNAPLIPANDKRPKVLLVTAERIPYFAHDAELKAILQEMNFNVVEKLFGDVTAADAADKVLLVIPSHRCRGNRVFAEVAVPIICWHAVWYEDLGMSDPATAKSDALKPVTLKFNEHPLVAGVAFPNGPSAKLNVYATGEPAPRAEIIASVLDQPKKAAIFGYEKESPMYGFTARARRLAFSVDVRNSADAPAELSKKLFIAAVKWASGVKAGE